MNRLDEDRRSAVRVKYDVSYWVAECEDERVPAQSTFRQVKGCDLSPVGISFYIDALPKSERLVLMFEGQKTKSYMLGEVIHHRSCPIEGRRRFLVGCEFVRAVFPDENKGASPPQTEELVGLGSHRPT